MKPKRKSPLAQLIASHKHLLRAFKHQTEEIGHLRKLILNRFPYDPVFAKKGHMSVTVGKRIRDPFEWPGVPLNDGHGNDISHLVNPHD